MINNIMVLIGILLYAIFSGVTQALKWENRPESDRYIGKYHFYRILQEVGRYLTYLGTLIWYRYSNLSNWRIVIILVALVLIDFLAYRNAFIKVRKQDDIVPLKWGWKIWIPLLGDKTIKYPSPILVWVGGIIGLFLIFIL